MNNKVFFIIFISIWLIIIILNFIWPKQIFSQEENRMLATVPSFSLESFIDGKYLNSMNDYINDHFAFRNFYLKLNSWWEVNVLNKKENNGVYIGNDGYLFEKIDNVDIDNTYKNAEVIDTFAKKMKAKNIPTYFLLIPNSIYINSDKLPDNVIPPDQEYTINEVYNRTNNCININIVDKLKEENKKIELYFKTDHHINSNGAFVIYSEFCRQTGKKIIDINEFEVRTLTNEFLGTFDSKAQILGQEKDTITVYENEINTDIKEAIYDKETTNSLFNEEYLSVKDKYSYFLNGNNSKAVIKTKVNNDKKLLVIKDSYAHIMSQFLCEEYSEVHFLDPRYTNFDYEDYITENGITDVMFLYNVSTFEKDVSIKNIN
jgi:hypothetical protein